MVHCPGFALFNHKLRNQEWKASEQGLYSIEGLRLECVWKLVFIHDSTRAPWEFC